MSPRCATTARTSSGRCRPLRSKAMPLDSWLGHVRVKGSGGEGRVAENVARARLWPRAPSGTARSARLGGRSRAVVERWRAEVVGGGGADRDRTDDLLREAE